MSGVEKMHVGAFVLLWRPPLQVTVLEAGKGVRTHDSQVNRDTCMTAQ